jgi:hypothetical protein
VSMCKPTDRVEIITSVQRRRRPREYDGFVIMEAPNEAAVTAFVLAAIGPGHIRATKTTVLRPEAVVEAMKKAGGMTYKGPKK